MNPHPDQVKAGKITAGALTLARSLCQKEIAAEQLDKELTDYIHGNGGIPALRGYHPRFGHEPYPNSICVCVNNGVVHGLPKGFTIKPDDIITVDLVVRCNTWHADAARTFTYSDNKNYNKFLKKCHNIFLAATSLIKPGSKMSLYGYAVETLANEEGVSVVSEFCGHGIGEGIHEPPQVINTFEPQNTDRFIPGQSYAVEPVLSEKPATITKKEDGWTFIADCLVAHYEDTFFVGNECILRLTEECNDGR